jgi:hypothetical protein
MSNEIHEVPRKKVSGPAMLPGMAMIAIFMLVLALFSAFAALNGRLNAQAKYLVLPAATILLVGVFGFLKLKRWGWAIVLAGTIMAMLGYFWVFRVTHDMHPAVMAGFCLIFFLYLVRADVRDRVH